ncbi:MULTISPECIES: hypothetical protein [unclassified Streptomyces]|nr:hypothetical protein [Streptomyces sp. NBC_01280]
MTQLRADGCDFRDEDVARLFLFERHPSTRSAASPFSFSTCAAG